MYASCLPNCRDVCARHCENLCAENRTLFVSKIQMYVRETSLVGKTHVLTYSRKVSRQGEKERRCSDLQGAKTSRRRSKLGACFYLQAHAESALSRFSYF